MHKEIEQVKDLKKELLELESKSQEELVRRYVE
jgi:hypothetical protein